MGQDKREFIINSLMSPGFMVHEAQDIILVETEETGKSELKVHLSSKDNLSIANVDKKKTEMQFFQKEASKSMFKRVDHIIFSHQYADQWKLYLIEMKGSVGDKNGLRLRENFVQAISWLRQSQVC